jgi:AcrR family transcriptional regulator
MFVKKNMRIAHLLLRRGRKGMAESPSNTVGMRRTPRQARSQERVKRILDVAEELFVAEGYMATTTNAIATRAQVPIGSLYQFFPDKSAILQALALRYSKLLHQALFMHDDSMSNERSSAPLSLPAYMDWMINTTDQFFRDYPGYRAIFMEVQGSVPELETIEEVADRQMIQDLAISLSQRAPGLTATDYEAIAFVLVKAIGTLLWLSLGQEESFRQRIVTETKRFAQTYLQSYFSPNPILADSAK